MYYVMFYTTEELEVIQNIVHAHDVYQAVRRMQAEAKDREHEPKEIYFQSSHINYPFARKAIENHYPDPRYAIRVD